MHRIPRTYRVLIAVWLAVLVATLAWPTGGDAVTNDGPRRYEDAQALAADLQILNAHLTAAKEQALKLRIELAAITVEVIRIQQLIQDIEVP